MIYIVLAASIFAGEFWLKNKIEKEQKEGEVRELLGGKVLLRKHHNKGFPLNKLDNRQPFVAAVSFGLAVFCTILFLVSLGKWGSSLLRTGLTLLLGGAYSNTYDRMYRKYVVDYFSINIGFKKLRSIIFNLSDFCIMIGALLCVIASEKE